MIVVAEIDRRDSVAEIVETPRFSEIDNGDAANVAVGAASSSLSVNVTADDKRPPLPPCTVADTVTRLSGASVISFTAVIVTVPVLVVAPAAMVSVFAFDSVKALATTGDTGTAETVIVVAALDGCASVALTVETSPFSEMDEGISVNVTIAGWR